MLLNIFSSMLTIFSNHFLSVMTAILLILDIPTSCKYLNSSTNAAISIPLNDSITSRIKNSASSGIAILFFLAVLVITIPGAYLWLPANVHYHIVEKHTVSVSIDQANVKIGIVIPKSGPYQTVSNTLIQWGGERERISFAYMDVYKLWGEVGEGQSQEAILEYDITLPQGKASWESPVEAKFTLPQEGIESDHPSITTQAVALLNDPYWIYQFTSQHLVFSEED